MRALPAFVIVFGVALSRAQGPLLTRLPATAPAAANLRSFSYTRADGRCAARASARVLAWGTQVDATDCAGRSIGIVQEHVYRSLFGMRAVYTLLDAHGHEVAASERVSWSSGDVAIRRTDGATVAELRAPKTTGGEWTVAMHDNSAADARLVMIAAAYKSAVGAER